jgi:hypothetical protein
VGLRKAIQSFRLRLHSGLRQRGTHPCRKGRVMDGAPGRYCALPHLKIEIWGTRFRGGLDVGHPPWMGDPPFSHPQSWSPIVHKIASR